MSLYRPHYLFIGLIPSLDERKDLFVRAGPVGRRGAETGAASASDRDGHHARQSRVEHARMRTYVLMASLMPETDGGPGSPRSPPQRIRRRLCLDSESRKGSWLSKYTLLCGHLARRQTSQLPTIYML